MDGAGVAGLVSLEANTNAPHSEQAGHNNTEQKAHKPTHKCGRVEPTQFRYCTCVRHQTSTTTASWVLLPARVWLVTWLQSVWSMSMPHGGPLEIPRPCTIGVQGAGCTIYGGWVVEAPAANKRSPRPGLCCNATSSDMSIVKLAAAPQSRA